MADTAGINVQISKKCIDNDYLLSIKVINTSNIEAEIFAFKRDTMGNDIFLQVCTLNQMQELEIQVPGTGSVFLRDNYVEIHYENIDGMLIDEDKFKIDIDRLLHDWNAYLANNINISYEQEFTGDGNVD